MKYKSDTKGRATGSGAFSGNGEPSFINPIYTEKNNCQDCYKCLRQCPVKAIKIEGASASVIAPECIYCGHCVQVCPAGAKKVRDDFGMLLRDIDRGEKVIACLAPSYISEFTGDEIELLVPALVKLGFYGVSETALGAEIVARETAALLHKQPAGILISSCCPSVVILINRYFPSQADRIAPVLSPMQAHSKMLKEMYGNEVKTAFFGPCIAKKYEVDLSPELTSYALTFADLRALVEMNGTGQMAGVTDNNGGFIPCRAGRGSFFPVDGGMIANMKRHTSLTDATYMSFSGVTRIKEVLADLSEGKISGPLFLELMTCEGGCVKGPCTVSDSSEASKRKRILTDASHREEPVNITETNIHFSQNDMSPLRAPQVSEEEIINALKASGKFTEADELNCGGCGYDNCRDFAAAMLQGKAERIMCVSYTRRVAQDKASVLLKKIPYGVVVADDSLRIIDANNLFVTMLGGDLPDIYSSVGGIEGSDLKKTVSFHRLFEAVLHSGEEMVERRIREKGMLLNVSVITIQPHKIVCGIIRNLQDPEVRKDHVLTTTRQVIRQNMEIVQKIAFLLGENAAYTESMLNSVAESVENEDNPSEE